jgi:hypothetical protein
MRRDSELQIDYAKIVREALKSFHRRDSMPRKALSSRFLKLPALLILALVVAIACVLWPTLLHAHGAIRMIYNFYSGPSHMTEVGERISYCDGHLEQWGTQTQYWTTDTFPCP